MILLDKGLKKNPENHWVKKAETIPWYAMEVFVYEISNQYDCSQCPLKGMGENDSGM